MIDTHSMTLRRFLVSTVAAFLIGTSLVPVAARAYDPNWTRQQAYAYAYAGLYEKYVEGGEKFIDNDTWDSNEGIDCSAYVSKVWAMPQWYPASQDGTPRYTTSSFYYHTNYWHHESVYSADFLHAFVWRGEAGGPTAGHTGLFMYQQSSGVWTTWEARGSEYGVVTNTRSLSTLDSWSSKGFDRDDWGTVNTCGCYPV